MMAEIDVQCQSLFIVFVCAVKQHEAGKEWASIACFYFDIKNNTEVLGIFNLTLVGIQSVRKTGITSENVYKPFKPLRRGLALWTSI